MVLSNFDKGRLIGLLQANTPIREVARIIGCDRNIVKKWWKQYKKEGHCNRKSGSGRPRKGSIRDDRHVVTEIKKNRFATSRGILQMAFYGRISPYSFRTARRRLREYGFRNCRPAIRIPLGPQNRQNRLVWCQDNVDKAPWYCESRFSLDFNDGRLRVWRTTTERFSDNCISEHDRYGSGSIMIWGGIWSTGRTEAVVVEGVLNGERYVNEIINPVIVPTLQQHNLQLQQDNARPHTCRMAKAALEDAGVQILQWPARSPDLSPIEHVWDMIQRKLNESDSPPTSLNSLKEKVIQSWNDIDQAEIFRLIESVPRRLSECITQKGGHTHY